MAKRPTATPAPKDYSARAAFSVDEWITDIYPQSRARFYEEVNSGQIKTFLDGKLRKIPASERIDYPARKLAESQAKSAA
jgi:hypothetical protein